MSSADDSTDAFPYVGWIPTVNARLSFRHIGEAIHPTRSVYANVITPAERYVLAYQRRNLSDALFQPITHFLWGISGSFWFVLSAASNSAPLDSTKLTGKVCIFKSKRDWRGANENKLRTAIRLLNDLRFALLPDRFAQMSRAFNKVNDYSFACADVTIDFILDRDGTVLFGKPQFKDSELQYASEDYARQLGHDFGKWIVDQSYFFLRDLSHTHKHHAPTSDTILITQDRDREDIQWRKNVIYSLYYHIIRTRRFGDAESQFQSLGVHAYCMSFKGICPPEALRQIPRFDDDALRQSIRSRAEEDVARKSDQLALAGYSLSKAANIRTFSFSAVAIVIALLAILIQPRISAADKEVFPFLYAASDYAARNFLEIVFVCVLLLFAIWAMTQRLWSTRYRIARDILEATNVRRRLFIVSSIASGLIIVAIAIYIFDDGINHLLRLIDDFLRVVRVPPP